MVRSSRIEFQTRGDYDNEDQGQLAMAQVIVDRDRFGKTFQGNHAQGSVLLALTFPKRLATQSKGNAA